MVSQRPFAFSRGFLKNSLSILIWASLIFSLFVPWPQVAFGEFHPSGKLEVHYINVGQGGCTLIIGPDGTRILYDFGDVSGDQDIVPYLQETIGLAPADGLHYAMVSHRDRDHYVGYREVVEAGYDVLIANYGPGSPKKATSFMKRCWLSPAQSTTAGEVQAVPVGMRIPLGDGAEALVVAANGVVLDQLEQPKISNENDRSIALYIHYGQFDFLLDGDLGSGREKCTEHQTQQKDVQSKVAQALLARGLLSPEFGVDVLHIAHHGSESSTSAEYFNLVRPEVGLINVGLEQGNFLHPRYDVVDRVLLNHERPACVQAPPLTALFQTEDGVADCSSSGCGSNSGWSVGDIKLVTDGQTGYEITGSNRVHGGTQEVPVDGQSWIFPLDEIAPQ